MPPGVTMCFSFLSSRSAAARMNTQHHARSRSNSRQKSGALSKRAISAGLKARGVEGAAVADALACVEIDDDHAMIALWRRRFGAPPVKLLRNPPVDDSSRA